MTLIMDEEFIFGTNILVAPVMDKGSAKRNVYLPAVINGSANTMDYQGLWWCEFDTGVWRFVDGVGRIVELGKLQTLCFPITPLFSDGLN